MWANFIWGFSFVCGRVSLCSLGWTETHYVAQVEFELKVTLPLNVGIKGICHHVPLLFFLS